ncbi:MAG: helix-turn-helix transcriptional regulator [Nocardioides sp.]
MGAGALQVGRESERELLAAVLRESASGHPGAVLVAGEAGIGKTNLVAEVTSGPAASGHLVLWGRCLRFGADSSPYLPWAQVLTQWHRKADPSERARVLAGAEHLATIAPALGDTAGTADKTRVPPLVATVLDRIADTTPLTLVLDDVQWADGTSLDLLAYVLAGFDFGQRLGVLVTYRDTDLGDGHRLHGWLADAVRLPSVSQVRLERLGFADAEELVARLGVGNASSPLADEIFGQAGGNPYYTEMLVRGAISGIGPERDGDLRQVLLSSWHRLDRNARELLQQLALGGRPVSLSMLERVFAARGGAPERAATSLAEATAAGLIAVGADGEAWFHHPLIAEVVATTLAPAVRVQIHQQYVEVLDSSADLPLASRAAHLALHHQGAGNPDEAFRWSLRAADEAAAVGGYAEVCDHLSRACQLWPDVSDQTRVAAGDRTDLWQRASEAAWSAGEYPLAVRLCQEALDSVDPEDDPVQAVRLGLRLMLWRGECGLEPSVRVESAAPMVDLAARLCPGTPEHALTLARLSFMERWSALPDRATQHALDAVRIARRTGSSEALAWALSMRASTRCGEAALADVLQAISLGREVDDPAVVGTTVLMGANCLEGLGRRADAAELLLGTFRRLLASGSVHDAMWAQPSFAAALLIEMGRWTEAREVLRELLSRRHPPEQAARVRGTAAVLAFRNGDVDAGREHLTRAREVLPEMRSASDIFGFIEVEGLWATGAPESALDHAAMVMAELIRVETRSANEMLALAARVAADLAERPGRRNDAVNLLAEIERLHATADTLSVPAGPCDLLHPAYLRIFAAERARCHGDPDTAAVWRSAVAACAKAGLTWDEALASYQLARSLLAVRGSRKEAASALRHAQRIATDLGATPILSDAEELARQAHISLAEPAPTVSATGRPDDPLSSLTAREREVLSHLVAGRTYAEIAQALCISEKTVSVHVSNLLRKTGTMSRIEVADLVRRTSATH